MNRTNWGGGEHVRSVCIGTTVLKLVSIPIMLISAQLLSNVVEYALGGQVEKTIKDGLIIIALTIIIVVAQLVGNSILRKKQVKALHKCKISFLQVLLENPLDHLFKANYGELTKNLSEDIPQAVGRFMISYPSVVASAVSAFGFALYLGIRNPLIASTLIVFSIIQLLPPLIVKKYMKVNYDACQQMEAKITDHLIEAVKGFEGIKLYGLKQWWQAKMSEYHGMYLKIGRKTDMLAAAQRTMFRALDSILQFGTYAVIGIYVMLGYCSMDSGIQAIYLSGGFFEAVKSFFSAIPEIAVARRAEERINKWSNKEHITEKSSALRFDRCVLKNVNYTYDQSHVIKGVSCRFDFTKTYLLEGNNGSGKSTLFNLVAGILLPESGEVQFEGSFSSKICSEFFPNILVAVPQVDPEYDFDINTLFSFFDDERQAEIYAVATRFGLTKKDMGGCTIRELSGGQRKKAFLSIGFALQPGLLLLDEPSNNLDIIGKKILCELIAERKGNIIISHDPIFKNIVVCRMKMENGCIQYEKK